MRRNRTHHVEPTVWTSTPPLFWPKPQRPGKAQPLIGDASAPVTVAVGSIPDTLTLKALNTHSYLLPRRRKPGAVTRLRVRVADLDLDLDLAEAVALALGGRVSPDPETPTAFRVFAEGAPLIAALAPLVAHLSAERRTDLADTLAAIDAANAARPRQAA